MGISNSLSNFGDTPDLCFTRCLSPSVWNKRGAENVNRGWGSGLRRGELGDTGLRCPASTHPAGGRVPKGREQGRKVRWPCTLVTTGLQEPRGRGRLGWTRLCRQKGERKATVGFVGSRPDPAEDGGALAEHSSSRCHNNPRRVCREL